MSTTTYGTARPSRSEDEALPLITVSELRHSPEWLEMFEEFKGLLKDLNITPEEAHRFGMRVCEEVAIRVVLDSEKTEHRAIITGYLSVTMTAMVAVSDASAMHFAGRLPSSVYLKVRNQRVDLYDHENGVLLDLAKSMLDTAYLRKRKANKPQGSKAQRKAEKKAKRRTK